MAYWEVSIRTEAADGIRGVQTFTYSAAEFSLATEVKAQARIDVATEDAIRHRRGARVNLKSIKAVWYDHI